MLPVTELMLYEDPDRLGEMCPGRHAEVADRPEPPSPLSAVSAAIKREFDPNYRTRLGGATPPVSAASELPTGLPLLEIKGSVSDICENC